MKTYQVIVSRERYEHACIVVEATNSQEAYIAACEAADNDPRGTEYEWETSDKANAAEASTPAEVVSP